MKRVLVVFPTEWDQRSLGPDAAIRERFDVVFAEPSDVDCDADLDIHSWVDAEAARWRGQLDGVVSSSDYPGATTAGVLAGVLGLPGARPERLLRCAHKYYSRIAQRSAAPEATPGFDLIDLRDPDHLVLPRLAFPYFVKPVKGAFSVLARRVADEPDLRRFLADPRVHEMTTAYLSMFNALVARYSDFECDGRAMIAEELITGDQVTVEGFVLDGEAELLGIVDSTFHPQHNSFLRFDYPSRLAPDVQDRMADISRRVMKEIGFRRSMFNIEMMYDAARNKIWIVEINARMCGQFADLYEKVDGINGYDVLLTLATGDTPQLTKGAGRYEAAASFPLRVFEPSRVIAVPTPDRVAAVERTRPGTHTFLECAAGDTLTDFGAEDGESLRYAVINLGASSRDALDDALEQVVGELGLDVRSA